jgi:hypothetical protein
MDHLCYRCSRNRDEQEEIKKKKEMELAHPEMKQLRLGPSEIGTLALIAPLSEDTSSSDQAVDGTPQDRLSIGETFILQIPNEIISKILTLVAVRPTFEYPKNYYGRVLPLVTVCRRFNHIATPLLYHKAVFKNHCGIVPPCLPARQFHRTVQENPLLRPYVKAVKLYIHDLYVARWQSEYDIANDDIANDFMIWFPNVTSFELQGGFATRKFTWQMIAKAVKHMPSIRKISLDRDDFAIRLCDVIENLNIPNLRKLEISGMQGSQNPENHLNCEHKTKHFGEKPAKVSYPFFYCTRNPMRPSRTGTPALNTPQGYERTGSLTSLILSDFELRPSDLAILLAWPKTLEHFTFENPDSSCTRWELSMVESLLAPHRSTLKSICIGPLTGDAGCINVTAFPELKALELSRLQWECSPEQACSTILAPKLENFTWNFEMYDRDSEQWANFDQPEVDWLLSFAKLASTQKSALKEIVIRYDGDQPSTPSSREVYEATEYPWDHMEQLKLMLKPLGIAFSCVPDLLYAKMDVERRLEEVEKRKITADIRPFLSHHLRRLG